MWNIDCGMHVSVSYTDGEVVERVPTPMVDGFSSLVFSRKHECHCASPMDQTEKKDGRSCAEFAESLGANNPFACSFRVKKNEQYGMVIGVETPPGIYEGVVNKPERSLSDHFSVRVLLIIASGLGFLYGLAAFGASLYDFCYNDSTQLIHPGKRGPGEGGDMEDLAQELTGPMIFLTPM